jgi:hypothetical protein
MCDESVLSLQCKQLELWGKWYISDLLQFIIYSSCLAVLLCTHKRQVQSQIKKLLVVYGVLMGLRPLIIAIGHYTIGVDTKNVILTTVWLDDLIMKWIFYYVLFKVKILSKILEFGMQQ